MNGNTFSTSMSPEVILDKVMGDLQVKGWDKPEIQIDADTEEVTVENQADSIHLSCMSDLSIKIPFGATVKAGQLYGDARFKQIEDSLTIERVMGSLILRDVGSAHIGQVNGDLSARRVGEDLFAGQVNGNAQVRECQGSCTLERVNGDLDLQSIGEGIQARADGNARLRLPTLEGETYLIKAEGNVQVEIPAKANATIHMSCDGSFIRVRLPDNSTTYRQERLDLTLGEGTTRMELIASGIISLSSLEGVNEEGEPSFFNGLPPDFGERISQQVEAQIEAQMETMTRQMNEHIARMTAALDRSGMSQQEEERIMDETRRKSEYAASRAEEKMRRMQEKMERKMDAHRRRAEAQAQAAEKRAQSSSRKGWHFEWSAPPSPPPPPAKGPVSEEERLTILKMLEQKKITLDEASQLLEALEGK